MTRTALAKAGTRDNMDDAEPTAPVENIMGTMSEGRLLFKMAMPMIFSVLVSSLYNIVDSIFVGRLGGASFCVGEGKTTPHSLTFFFPSCYP